VLSRDCELSDLQGVLASAASGVGASLLLEGGIGSGKSYLARTAVRTARTGGLHAVSLRARPSGTALACDALRQLQHGVAAVPSPADAAARHTAGRAHSPEAAADWLDRFVAALTPRTPVLIAVDDLHWADEGSLHWLEHLMARLEGLPVALLATITPGLSSARDDGPGHGRNAAPPADDHAAGARGNGARGVGTHTERAAVLARVVSDFQQRTVLPGLSPAAVGYLLTSFFGGPVADAVVSACHRVTGGNPLLVHALLRELKRGGKAAGPTCEQVDRLGSVEIAETVLARFRDRFPAAGRTLEAVAVTGRADSDAALVADLAGIPRPEAADMLHALARCGVLKESGGDVVFAQPMMRTSFLAALPPSEHDRLHTAAARALHAAGAPAQEVVHHLRHTPPIGGRWAYRLLFDSACAALARKDLKEARILLERCIQEGDAGDRPELLRLLGYVDVVADAPAAAVRRLRTLERPCHGDDTTTLTLLVNLVQAIALDGDLDGAERTARAGLTGVEPVGPAQEPAAGAFAVLGVLGLLTGRQRTAPSVPAAFATRTSWVRCAQAALSALTARAHSGQRAEVLHHARAGLREPVFSADVPTTPLRLLLAHLLCEAGEHDEALAACRRLAAAAHAQGARTMAALAETVLAMCGYRAGRLSEAARAARSALAEGPPGIWLGSALARCWLGGILVESGDLDGARRLLLDNLSPTDLPQAAVPDLLFHRGRLHAALGHTHAGIADLEECGRRLPRSPHGYDRHPWRTAAAALYADVDDRAAAKRLAREELELARAWGAPHTVATALHTLALITRSGHRLSLLRDADGLLRDSGAWLEHARVLRSLGHELLRLSKIRQAREQLRAALALAEKCGAGPLVDGLRADLTSAGARPRRVETGLDALTPAEYRTAVLAAEGLTNKEIADRLYVTRRTVELHLTRVYRKLSLSGRAALPAAVAGRVTDPDRRSLRRVGTDGPASSPKTARRSTRLRPAS